MSISRLWALSGGRLTMAGADLMEGGSGVAQLVVSSFLIDHGDRMVLVDTGLDPLAAGGLETDVYRAVGDAMVIHLEPGETLGRQLLRIGRRPSQVTDVVLTHSHLDHTGGLAVVPQAKVHLQESEWQYVQQNLASDRGRALFKDFERLDTNRLVVHDGDVDLFGDTSFQMIHLPGHTPGNMAVLIRMPTRTVVLSGDTVHLRAGLDSETPMPSDWDQDRSASSIRRLKTLAESEDAPIWIGHDPDDWRAWQAPGSYR